MTTRAPEERERIYGPPGYLEWGWRMPCLVVGCEVWIPRPGSDHAIECCHLHTGGTGRKDDWTRTFFACWRHHDLAAMDRREFERAHKLRVATALEEVEVATLAEACGVTQEMWDRYENGLNY